MVKEISEEIVIAGLACRLPESENAEEFWSHLINKEDMITDDDRRWPPGLYGLPERSGKLKDINHFDASFFSVHPKQANKMDPQLRILLELTYEALIDAGINPQSARNSRTGVFVGASSSEASEANSSVPEEINGYGLVGGCRAMFSNRVSFSFDFKGPSFTIDTACSSSLLAMDCAVQSIRSGACDAAVVGGVNLTMKPHNSVDFLRLNMLSADGKCKSFDESGNGYVRAEGAVCIYLVKKHVAKRIYAHVINSKTNSDGYKTQGVTYPSGSVQKQLLQEVYAEALVNPSHVSYIEAHGTGTKAGDPEEVNTIASVFCGGREVGAPLLIGSVKSNMGHSEPASGLAGVVKVLLSMQHDMLPPNLHYENPNPDIPGLTDGRLKVVTEPTKWNGGYVGINSFGFGGSNVHVILRSPDVSSTKQIQNDVQVCVPVSGRTEDGVKKMLELTRRNFRNADVVSLVADLSATSLNNFPYRGYTILSDRNPVEIVTKTTVRDRQLWYVFSGMGAQWSGMGRKMMSIPTFKQSIESTSKYLNEYEYNLLKLLNDDDEDAYKNILNSFVGTAAIQIALVDCLNAVGLQPDGIVGHSVGELGCAYADRSFTAEEVIKAAYWRGRCVNEAKLPTGGMAAVGLTWEEARKRCPPGIIPACHNSSNTITLSGELSALKAFLEILRNEKIFVKEVNTSGIAFHSKYMEAIVPDLRSSLEKFIIPKRRSAKWLSTSIPEKRWNSDLAQYSSADYHVNNLVSPVLFQEAIEMIPKSAIVVEIAPHCLLQAVLRRSLNEESAIIPLMKKDHSNNVEFFLSNLGNIYIAGKNFNPTVLSCTKQYPVPACTPSISSFMQWDHSTEWDIPQLENFSSGGGDGNVSSFKFDIDISPSSENNYLVGHCIDGRVLFPATGYLVLAWRALAKNLGLIPDKLRVGFQDIQIHRATILPATNVVTLTVYLLPASNKFDVSEGDNLLVSGKIFVLDEKDAANPINIDMQNEGDGITLTSQCIYKELRLRGYDYGSTFQGIITANNEGTKGELIWNNNWITFLDSMLQISVLRLQGQSLRLPTRIRSVKIDPVLHLEQIRDGVCNVAVDPCLDMVISGGVKMYGVHASVAPKRQDSQSPILERYIHVPYAMDGWKYQSDESMENSHLKKDEVLKIFLDIVIENTLKLNIDVCEINAAENKIYSDIVSFINDQPQMQVSYLATEKNEELLLKVESSTELDIETCVWDPVKKSPNQVGKVDLIIASKFSQETHLSNIIANIKSALNSQGFLLLCEPLNEYSIKVEECLKDEGFVLVSSKETTNSLLQLYREVLDSSVENVCFIDIDNSWEWIGKLKDELQSKSDQPIWLKAECLPYSGIVGMVNCLRREPGGNRIRCIFDADSSSNGNLMETFDKLCQLDLSMNILKGSSFGSYRHIQIENHRNFASETQHAYVDVLNRGDLSSLRWISSPLKFAKKTSGNMELCNVYYTSLNFRDIMLATGKLPPDALPGNLTNQDCILGMEFSGRNELGKRIMGLLPAKALATSVLSDRSFTWEIPDKWSLADAATVPVVYSTAYYALFIRGHLRHGESVLIHSGSGGVGQAAISICLSIGCDVYTTVGTKEKKQYLLSRFPKLKNENIGNSRDLSFEDMVMRGTSGKGVDIVLNSLSEEKLQASVRCLGQHGRFLEIGKYDLSNNSPLGMAVFLKNVSFHGILLDAIFENSNRDWKEVYELVSTGIRSGVVRPLKTTIFVSDQVEPAFRFMAQGKHIGKVLIQVRNEQAGLSSQLNVLSRSMCDPMKSYVISGGLGGFGLELADWLIARGGRQLVLTSRRGVRTGYQARKIKLWREKGVKVVVSTADVSCKEGAENVINTAQSLAQLGGIFHLAVVLKDRTFENQNAETFFDVCRPKCDGAMWLDKITRQDDISKDLHWFVVFSSIVSGRGNPGQTNYGFANSSMERLCEKRVDDGLPGLAIQWGAIGDVGLVQEAMAGTNDTVIGGTLPQRISNCLSCLDQFLQKPYPVVSSYVLAAKHSFKNSKDTKDNIIHSVARILGVKDCDAINPDATLSDLGLDSLMGVEIKQVLERDYDIHLQTDEIRQLSMNSLKSLGEKDVTSPDIDSKDGGNELTDERNVDIMSLTQIPTYSEETIVKLNDVTQGSRKVLLIHNIYGTIDPLKYLATLFTSPVYGVQYSRNAPVGTIQELASFYAQHIKEVVPVGPYVIVGYSFGSAVALELSFNLRKQGDAVSLVMLDGSHKSVLSYSTFYRKRYNANTDHEADTDLLCILAKNVSPVNEMNLRNTLIGLHSIQSQIDVTFNAIINANQSLDKQSVLSYVQFFISLLRMGEKYKASENYNRSIAVIRAKTVDSLSSQLGDDLGVKEICDGSVMTAWVDGDHLSILNGQSAKDIVNIIDAFQS